mgnify:CR=1 FL=1
MMLACSNCNQLVGANHRCPPKCEELGYHINVRERVVVHRRFFTHTERYCANCLKVVS